MGCNASAARYQAEDPSAASRVKPEVVQDQPAAREAAADPRWALKTCKETQDEVEIENNASIVEDKAALVTRSPLPDILLPQVLDRSWYIKVRRILGDVKDVIVNPTDTIRIVKARLRQQAGGPLESKIFKLVFQGRSLEPASIVGEYLQKGSIVDAVILEKEELDVWWEDHRNFEVNKRDDLHDPMSGSKTKKKAAEKAAAEEDDLHDPMSGSKTKKKAAEKAAAKEVITVAAMQTYRHVATWSGQQRTWKALAVHEDVLFGSTFGQNTVVAMTLTGETIREYHGMSTAEGVAVDGKLVYVSDRKGHRVMIFEKDTAKLMRCIAQGQVKEPQGLAIDGSVLYAASIGDGTLYAFNLENGGFNVKWGTHGLCTPAGICYDSSHVYVAELFGGCITAIDKQTGTKTQRICSGLRSPHGLQLLGNSQLIVAESGRSTVRILDKQSGADVTRWSVHDVCAVAVSSTNAVFAAGHWSSSNAVQVFQPLY